MIFVACPYWDPNPLIRRMRVDIATAYTWALIRKGECAISPITHSFGFVSKGLEMPEPDWRQLALGMLERSKSVHVLAIMGFTDSKGVNGEVSAAEFNGIPVKYITPAEIDEAIKHLPN